MKKTPEVKIDPPSSQENDPGKPTSKSKMPPPPPPSSKLVSSSQRDNTLGVVKSTNMLQAGSAAGTGAGSSNTLGNDLVKPARSEFKLKRSLDANDRGRPMVDWIRKQSTQHNSHYTGPPPMTRITPEELQKHNTSEDAWLALRGLVFDVTEYIRFHPGGVSEIMKGVGKDATALFNSIHRYVNFESILKGKQVGIYDPSGRNPTSSQFENGEDEEDDLVEPSSQPKVEAGEQNFCGCCFNIFGCCSNASSKKVSGGYESEMIPDTKFYEDDENAYFQVDLKGFKYRKDYWSVAIVSKNTLLIKVLTISPEMCVLHYKLRETLTDDTLNVKFTNRYRTMTVSLEKPNSLTWETIGDPLPESELIIDSRNSVADRIPCTLVLRKKLANEMYLMAFKLSPTAIIGVPTGFDVKIRAIHDGVSRRYTPIPLLFNTNLLLKSDKQIIYCVIKVYPDGKMTQILKTIELGKQNVLDIGSSCGNFNTDWLHGASFYFLLAAGSGITPYIGILKFFIEHNIAIGATQVILVHWSKKAEDIIWKKEFLELEKKKKWFKFLPVLTQIDDDDNSWKGLKGRISYQLFSKIIAKSAAANKKKDRVRFMTCGPDGFNTSVCVTIEQAGYSLDSTFIFLG